MKKDKVVKKRREKTEDFLIKNKTLLNITGIERKSDVPKGTIQKFITLNRIIDDKRIFKINKVIREMFIDYDE